MIFGESIASKSFLAFVTPIFKAGQRCDVRNYRPISILSCMGKHLDNLMCQRFSNAFKDVLSARQHAYREGFSTVTNLAEYTTKIINSMEKGGQVDAAYLDFSKAFDFIDHSILLTKLSCYGVDDATVDWVASYLHNRKQQVRVNHFLSREYVCTSGVPQGSHLGPVLFAIYINDLLSNLSDVDVSSYADDIKIFKEVNSVLDRDLINIALLKIFEWGDRNGMRLNLPKCHIITFTRKRNWSEHKYTVTGVELQRVSEFVDLGALLTSKMDFNAHVGYITSKAMSILGLVIRFSKEFNDVNVTKTLYCSLVRSRLEYAAVVWNPHHVTYSNQLEPVQKQFLMF